ncbi:MAG: hypothetical protein M1135_00275 [Candidatus Omnitrophica bacterium]|jgi:hypothetical protein|nr:hypothetical protein [Candidatus Omnitrophota bacterium]
MKKLILFAIIILLLFFIPKSFANPTGNWFSDWFSKNNNPSYNIKHKIVWQLKTAMKIRRQMRDIRIKTIKSNPQLKQDFEQIRLLAAHLHKILSKKLKYNKKYQNLKQQLQTIRKELQKERKYLKN